MARTALFVEGRVDRNAIAVGEAIGLVRHADDRHQLAEHGLGHAGLARGRAVAGDANFWKFLAHDPATLKRTWQSLKEIMAPGALDAVTKEMVYLAVSVTNGCGYCIASHGAAARKAGMTEAMFGELMAVVGMTNETNRLANGYRVPVDPAFDK